MSAAQNILAELEALGALGEVKPAVPEPEPSVQEVTIQAGSPAGVLRDERGLKMLQYTERAVELLDKSIAAQMELREVFVELHDLWVEDEGPGDEEESPGDEEESEEDEGEEDGGDDEEEEGLVAEPALEAPADKDAAFELVVPEPVLPGEAVEAPAPVFEASAPSVPPPQTPPPVLTERRKRFFQTLQEEAKKGPRPSAATPHLSRN